MRQIVSKGLVAFAALSLVMGGFVAISSPVQAATKYTTITKCTKATHWYYVVVKGVKKKHYYTKTTCAKVRVLISSLKTLKSTATSYYPGYNLMKITGSSRSLPKSLVAVCGDGTNITSAVTSATCKTHQGVAWCVNIKSSGYCPK